jgi:hypothetical protein
MADTPLTDPLGRTVVLHDSTWYGHIVRGHPEVAGARHLIEQAVITPLEIRLSNADADCRLYFGPGPRSLLVKVVADVVRGVVKTAHLARKTSGGSVEWSPPTP